MKKQVKVEWCENWIKAQFTKHHAFPGPNAGIEINHFWEKAEKSGLYERGTYGTPMSEAVHKLTRIVDVRGEDGNIIYSVFQRKITPEEVRAQVPPMAIWMADAVIREACRALSGKTGWNDVHRSPLNLPEVEMAGEIMCRMFANVSRINIKDALIAVEKSGMDGVFNYSRNYFDEFVKELSSLTRDALGIRELSYPLEYC